MPTRLPVGRQVARNDDLILYSLASDAPPNSPLSVYKLSSKATLDKTPTIDVQ